MKASTAIVHLSLLALGLLFGLALIYSIQPPKPPPGALLHEISTFSSEKPINDFAPYFQALAFNASQGVVFTQGGNQIGSIQFSSEPKMLTQFNLVVPDRSSTLTILTPLTCKTRTEVDGDRLRTSFQVDVDNLKATHHFELGDGEYRAIEILKGEVGRRYWCYAIIKVDRAQPTPVSSLILVRPVTPPIPGKP